MHTIWLARHLSKSQKWFADLHFDIVVAGYVHCAD